MIFFNLFIHFLQWTMLKLQMQKMCWLTIKAIVNVKFGITASILLNDTLVDRGGLLFAILPTDHTVLLWSKIKTLCERAVIHVSSERGGICIRHIQISWQTLCWHHWKYSWWNINIPWYTIFSCGLHELMKTGRLRFILCKTVKVHVLLRVPSSHSLDYLDLLEERHT